IEAADLHGERQTGFAFAGGLVVGLERFTDRRHRGGCGDAVPYRRGGHLAHPGGLRPHREGGVLRRLVAVRTDHIGKYYRAILASVFVGCVGAERRRTTHRYRILVRFRFAPTHPTELVYDSGFCRTWRMTTATALNTSSTPSSTMIPLAAMR